MGFLRLVCFMLYINSIYCGNISISSSSDFNYCSSCVREPVTCNGADKSSSSSSNKFDASLYFCDRCNVHTSKNSTLKLNLYCNFCENIIPCHMDTGCYHCIGC